MEVFYNNKFVFGCSDHLALSDFSELVKAHLNLLPDEYYLLQNGKRHNSIDSKCRKIEIVLRLLGGKGGFGSMLRAIGAQIEKTTNREACRDLSGRRLRDINEEKRLKTWIAQQAEREKEAAERKQKKLERLCQEPKHEFKDETYDKIRSALPEQVEDAVLQGLKASTTSATAAITTTVTDRKRKSEEIKGSVVAKKKKLWFDEELSASDDDDDDDDDSDNDTVVKDVKSELICIENHNTNNQNNVVT